MFKGDLVIQSICELLLIGQSAEWHPFVVCRGVPCRKAQPENSCEKRQENQKRSLLIAQEVAALPSQSSSPPWKPTHLLMAVGIDQRGTRDRPTRVKTAQTRQRPHSLKGAKVGQNKQALPPLEPGVGSCSRRGPPGPPGPRPPQAPCGTTALRTQSRPPCGLAQLPPPGAGRRSRARPRRDGGGRGDGGG